MTGFQLHAFAAMEAFGLVPLLSRLWLAKEGGRPFLACWAVADLFMAALALSTGQREDAGIFAAGVLAALLWDWRDRGGRRAARALGAKSKALRDAVVARAREAGTPMPKGAAG